MDDLSDLLRNADNADEILKGIKAVAEAIERAITSAKAAQRASGYLEDAFTGTIIPKGTKIYGGLPEQTSWYTDLASLEASGYSRVSCFKVSRFNHTLNWAIDLK